MKLAFSYSWLLRHGNFAQAEAIIRRLHQHAIELGGEVSGVNVLIGEEAQAVQPRANRVAMFTATIPGATEGRFGLASTGNFSWSWQAAVVISDVKPISDMNTVAVDLGLEVAEVYAGMIFTSKKNAAGVLETEQRQAFDWTTF